MKIIGVGKLCLLVAIACVLSTASRASTKEEAQDRRERPNILVVIIDDLGPERWGPMDVGGAPAPTPSLDHYAGLGIRFSNFWSYPVCSPTRAAVHLGRYGLRTGVGDSIGNRGFDIGLSERFLPALLADAGYDTGLVGKFHLASTARLPNGPNDYGYQRFFGTAANLEYRTASYFRFPAIADGETFIVEEYATTQVTDWAVARLQTAQEPWFTTVAFHAPHDPWHAPPAELHTQDLSTYEGPEIQPKPYQVAMIEALDTEFERLMEAVDLTDTTVLVLSDNGSPSSVASPPVLSHRAKSSVFRGGVNTPFFAFGSAVTDAGQVSEGLIDATDVFATVLELAGVEEPPSVILDSISLVPYLSNASTPSLRKWVYTERFSPNGFGPRDFWNRSAARDDYVLIRYLDGREQLTHRRDDPWQNENLLEEPLTPEMQEAYDYLTLILSDLEIGSSPGHE